MGGIGSGRRYRWDTKDTTNDYRSIDIRRWHQNKLLIPNQSFITSWIQDGEITSSIEVHIQTQHITLSYNHRNSNDDWVKLSYPVLIDWTSCNYGKKRPWFLCPGQNCQKRVAILYSGKIFACRHCYRLTYPCQQETFSYRAMLQAEKIRKEFGWKTGFSDFPGSRPKGMHRQTFERLLLKYNQYVDQSTEWITNQFNLLGESFDSDYESMAHLT